MTTLLLNATYEPLRILSLKRALSLIERGKVEPVGEAVQQIRTAQTIVCIPRVLRLVYYVNVPRKRPRWSAKETFERDNYTCAYCGKTGTKKTLTIDHIIPKSQGGGKDWSNLITACKRCNHHKANRTPEEANMPLLFQPEIPKGNMLVFSGKVPVEWAVYLNV